MGTKKTEAEVSTKPGVAQVDTNMAEAEVGSGHQGDWITGGRQQNGLREVSVPWVTDKMHCIGMNKDLQNTKYFYRSKFKA